MDINSELKGAQLEIKDGDYTHSVNEKGRIWLNRSEDEVKVSKNAQIEKVLTYFTDSSSVVQSNGMAALRDLLFPVAEVKLGMLTLAQFQADYSTKWLMISGQTLVAADYPELASRRPEWLDGAGNIILPKGGDFLRINTARALGNHEADEFKSHNHGGGNHRHDTGIRITGANAAKHGYYTETASYAADVVAQSTVRLPYTDYSGTIINTEGGAETRPKNIAINAFIKVLP